MRKSWPFCPGLRVGRTQRTGAGCFRRRAHGGGGWDWVGATAVSTGKTGTFEHFLTPLDDLAHTLDNPDFRAEGTFNKNHIRGYGLRGRRTFDFGWQTADGAGAPVARARCVCRCT